MNGGFLEAEKKEIVLNDEDPDLFGFFVEYLYTDKWVDMDVETDSEYVVLVRLYVLGERLQAQRFKMAILAKFLAKFPTSCQQNNNPPQNNKLPLHHVCEMLDVILGELPEVGDPLRAQLFWYAAQQVESLRGQPYFRRLLGSYSKLGVELVMLTNGSSKEQPEKPQSKLPSRFSQESTFPN